MKRVAFFVFFCCALSAVYAFGSRDITETELVPLESWQETADISAKKRENTTFL